MEAGREEKEKREVPANIGVVIFWDCGGASFYMHVYMLRSNFLSGVYMFRLNFILDPTILNPPDDAAENEEKRR